MISFVHPAVIPTCAYKGFISSLPTRIIAQGCAPPDHTNTFCESLLFLKVTESGPKFDGVCPADDEAVAIPDGEEAVRIRAESVPGLDKSVADGLVRGVRVMSTELLCLEIASGRLKRNALAPLLIFLL